LFSAIDLAAATPDQVLVLRQFFNKSGNVSSLDRTLACDQEKLC
jgi:hypothetical protein